MQALLLNGSPRGAASNTLRLSRAFLQGTGWLFETFSLTENRIEPCRGCMPAGAAAPPARLRTISLLLSDSSAGQTC